MDKESFGQRLKMRRMERNISQTEMAKRLNMNHSNIGKYERGAVMPPIEVLTKIAEMLDTSVAWMMGEAENSPSLRDVRMAKRLDELMTLSESDLEHVFFLLDAIIRDARTRRSYAQSA